MDTLDAFKLSASADGIDLPKVFEYYDSLSFAELAEEYEFMAIKYSYVAGKDPSEKDYQENVYVCKWLLEYLEDLIAERVVILYRNGEL